MEKETNLRDEKKYGYKDVFTQKEYCKLILSNIISRFGDSVDAIAFTWLVYQVTGSAAWSAIVYAVNQLPSILVQPFAGALVEGMNKKKILVLTDLIRFVVVAALGFIYLFSAVTPLILVIFTLIISTVEAFALPAGMAIIPRIINKDLYSYGSSLNKTICTIVELTGLGLGGVIIAAFGIHTALLIDAVTFLLSAVIIAFMKISESAHEKVALNAKEYITTLKEGFSYIKNKEIIKNFCILGVFINAAIVPLNSLQSPIISEVLGGGSELLSVFGLAMTCGMGLGAFVFPKLSEKFTSKQLIIAPGIIVGISMAMFPVAGLFKGNTVIVYILTVLISLVLCFFASLITCVLSVQFVKVVEEDYLARAGSMFNACACASTPVASLIVSLLVALLSTSNILVICGILCAIIFIVLGIRNVKFE